jgi:hypothetical protein
MSKNFHVPIQGRYEGYNFIVGATPRIWETVKYEAAKSEGLLYLILKEHLRLITIFKNNRFLGTPPKKI